MANKKRLIDANELTDRLNHTTYEAGMSPNQVNADDFCSYGESRDGNG